MISGERTEQLYIFCRVTGFTSDFLSFIDVELIRFFHGALKLIIKCESIRETTFTVYSPSLQYLLRVTAGYRLTSGRMTRVHQQNYRLRTSTDVAERVVV